MSEMPNGTAVVFLLEGRVVVVGKDTTENRKEIADDDIGFKR